MQLGRLHAGAQRMETLPCPERLSPLMPESGWDRAKWDCWRVGGQHLLPAHAAVTAVPAGSPSDHSAAAPACLETDQPLFPLNKANGLIAKRCVCFYNNITKHLSEFTRTRLGSRVKPLYAHKCSKEPEIGLLRLSVLHLS